ncbi:uncharacterized protein RAG0_05039 [Rhynchosporium agropyri]|uniref:Uncharacterized protein n=1 Tax=Rhynchosporium agropyri TaxID=914238 RepID=A0A1E1KBD9_9HELO|nr:uncharacterized protein RAG0_05039 [Rhynchosporium agropyri]
MKSQEAAFRDARKPQPKPKVQQPVVKATGNKIAKNASRNERRKAARKVRSILKESGGVPSRKKNVEVEATKGDESEDGACEDAVRDLKQFESGLRAGLVEQAPM